MVIAHEMIAPHYSHMSQTPESLLPANVALEMRPERIGYRLTLLRESLGMKPAEIADKLGIERTYWSRFEGGKRAISPSVAALLVAHFDVTLDFLILGRWDKLPFDVAERLRSVEVSK